MMVNRLTAMVCLFFCSCLSSVTAQNKTAATAQSTPVLANKSDTLAQLLELSRPNSHHLLISRIAGKWQFQDAKRPFVKGTVVRKPLYDGRFYTVEITGGKLQVPIADGKMKEDNYQGFQMEGYDNVRKSFTSTSINNHIGSDIQVQTGTYDPASNTFTYYWDSELIMGARVKNKRTLTIVDDSHYIERYFEERTGTYVPVRELEYSKVSPD